MNKTRVREDAEGEKWQGGTHYNELSSELTYAKVPHVCGQNMGGVGVGVGAGCVASLANKQISDELLILIQCH